MANLDAPPRKAIRSTRWSIVLAASELSDPASRQALAWLYEAYWYALYAFARRHGRSAEGAQDAVQGFFAALLEKNGLRTADPGRGRFRSFLLAAFRHHLANERNRRTALKRGGGKRELTLDLTDAESRYGREPTDDSTPERVFERRWALTVIDRSLERLRRECEKAGNSARFEELKGFLTGDRERGATAAAAERLALSEGAVRVAVHRLRGRFGELLRNELAATLEHPADIDDEMRHLLSVLRK